MPVPQSIRERKTFPVRTARLPAGATSIEDLSIGPEVPEDRRESFRDRAQEHFTQQRRRGQDFKDVIRTPDGRLMATKRNGKVTFLKSAEQLEAEGDVEGAATAKRLEEFHAIKNVSFGDRFAKHGTTNSGNIVESKTLAELGADDIDFDGMDDRSRPLVITDRDVAEIREKFGAFPSPNVPVYKGQAIKDIPAVLGIYATNKEELDAAIPLVYKAQAKALRMAVKTGDARYAQFLPMLAAKAKNLESKRQEIAEAEMEAEQARLKALEPPSAQDIRTRFDVMQKTAEAQLGSNQAAVQQIDMRLQGIEEGTIDVGGRKEKKAEVERLQNLKDSLVRQQQAIYDMNAELGRFTAIGGDPFRFITSQIEQLDTTESELSQIGEYLERTDVPTTLEFLINVLQVDERKAIDLINLAIIGQFNAAAPR